MKDPELRSVSLAARGLWIDMLSLMFECDRRGYLQLNGKPVNADQLARMTGCSTGEVSHCLQELDNSGVFSRSDDGTIYSRRLVRDEKIRNQTADRVKRYRNGDVTHLVTQVKRSCTEDEEEIEVEIIKPESLGKNPKTIKEVVAEFDFQQFAELIYADYPRKVGRGTALKAIESAIRKLSKRNKCADFEAAKFIHDKVLEYAKSQAGNSGKFTPHCSTWMNSLRFEDDTKEWNRDDRQDNSTEEAKRILGLAD